MLAPLQRKRTKGKNTTASVQKQYPSIKLKKSARTIAALENALEDLKRIQWETEITESIEDNNLSKANRILQEFKNKELGEDNLAEVLSLFSDGPDNALDKMEKRFEKLTGRELSKEKESIAKSLSSDKGIVFSKTDGDKRLRELEDPDDFQTLESVQKFKPQLKSAARAMKQRRQTAESETTSQLFKVSEKELNDLMDVGLEGDEKELASKFAELYRTASLNGPADCKREWLMEDQKKDAKRIMQEIKEIRSIKEEPSGDKMSEVERKDLIKNALKNTQRENAEIKKKVEEITNLIKVMQTKDLQEFELQRIERERQEEFRVTQNQLNNKVLEYHEKALDMLSILNMKQDRQTRKFQNGYGLQWFIEDILELLKSMVWDRSLSKSFQSFKQLAKTIMRSFFDTVAYGFTNFFGIFACFEESVVGCFVARIFKVLAATVIVFLFLYFFQWIYGLFSPVHTYLKCIANSLWNMANFLAEQLRPYVPQQVTDIITGIIEFLSDGFEWLITNGNWWCYIAALVVGVKTFIGWALCTASNNSVGFWSFGYLKKECFVFEGNAFMELLKATLNDCVKENTVARGAAAYRPPTYFQGRLKF